MIILHNLHLLFLLFVTQRIVCSPNGDEMWMCFKFQGYLWLLMILLCLICFWFCHGLHVVRKFLLFLWIFLSCFCCISTRMQRVFHWYVFWGSSVLFMAFFLLIWITYLLVLSGILSGRGPHAFLLDELFYFFFSDYVAYFTC